MDNKIKVDTLVRLFTKSRWISVEKNSSYDFKDEKTVLYNSTTWLCYSLKYIDGQIILNLNNHNYKVEYMNDYLLKLCLDNESFFLTREK